MSAPITNTQEASSAAIHLLATKYYAAASLAMVTYDIILTSSVEYEKIWKQRMSGMTVLWVLNRWWFYLTLWVAIVGYMDPSWSLVACDNYFQFIGVSNSIQRLIVGIIFTFRIYCIYNRSRPVTALLSSSVVTEFTVKLYSTLRFAEPVLLPPGLTGCVLSVAPQNANKFLGYWIMETVTDGMVVILTINRAYHAYWKTKVFRNHPIWDVIFKDGLVYFVVLLSSNLTNVIFYLVMPQDLKSVNATFTAAVTCLLVARLILNLKVAASEGHIVDAQVSTFLAHQSHLESRVLGNMANKMEGLDTPQSLTLQGEGDSMELRERETSSWK